MAEQDDSTLVGRVLEGDRGAFSAIYSRHVSTVSRRLRRILVRTEDVEDVVQNTFVTAFRSLHNFRRDGSLAAWLHGIAVRSAANHLRAQRRRWWLRGVDAGQIEETASAGGRSSEERAGDRQLLRRIWPALVALPVDKRIAFALHDLEQMSAREIGELVGCSEKTIWSRVESARRILAKKLQRSLGEAAVSNVELEVKT